MNAVQEAASLAKRVPLGEIDKKEVTLKMVSTQLDSLVRFRDSLLGIEWVAKSEIEKRIKKLSSEQSELKKWVNLGSKYSLLSMDPLSWRDEKGFPRLVTFSLASSIFKLSLEWEKNDYRYTGNLLSQFNPPEIPEVIQRRYADVFLTMRKVLSGHSGDVWCQFSGVIPAEVKWKISQAIPDFEQVFIIAEPAKGLKVNIGSSLDPDPLVVGFDGTRLWLIAVFDITAVEETALLHSGILMPE